MNMRCERIRPAYLSTALGYSLYSRSPFLPSFCLKRKGRMQKRVFVLAARACYWQIALAARISRFFLATRASYWQLALVTRSSRILLATRACYWQLALVTGISRLLLATHARNRQLAHVTGNSRPLLANRSCCWQPACSRQLALVTGNSHMLLADCKKELQAPYVDVLPAFCQ